MKLEKLALVLGLVGFILVSRGVVSGIPGRPVLAHDTPSPDGPLDPGDARHAGGTAGDRDLAASPERRRRAGHTRVRGARDPGRQIRDGRRSPVVAHARGPVRSRPIRAIRGPTTTRPWRSTISATSTTRSGRSRPPRRAVFRSAIRGRARSRSTGAPTPSPPRAAATRPSTSSSRYAAFVRDRDPKSAEMATSYAATCRPSAVPVTPAR